MIINWNDPSIRLTGRWDRRNGEFTSTSTNGSRAEIATKGRMAILLFDISTNSVPNPHLWIQVDNGPKIEAPVTRILHVDCKTDAAHIINVIMKSSSEGQSRWFAPVEAVVRFCGVDVDAPGVLPADARPVLEVVGDSITEGVLIEVDHTDTGDAHQRVYQDDACGTYVWICAEELNMRPRQVGFGAVGTLKSGSGDVPKVTESYPYVYDGCPVDEEKAKIIVINHGTNDWGRSVEDYGPAYKETLSVIRKHNPDAVICALSPFCGCFEAALPAILDEFNSENKDNVRFISTKGWLPVEPVHPLRAGHAKAGKLLAEAIKNLGIL